MRKIWLKKIDTGEIWDLLPDDPHNENVMGSPLLSIKGMGYKQSITQNQVDTEYFISQISTANVPITGIMWFRDDDHIKKFQEYIGDFRNQLYLYYSPSGEYEPYDQISAPFYKKVILTQADKTELTAYGDYEISVTFATQDDVWNRDVYYQINDLSEVGQALVYPYIYPYEYGGRNALAIEINNKGREVGTVVKIKNNSDTNSLSNIEWFIDRDYVDYYGVAHEHADVQRSRWNLSLPPKAELVVDSNPLTQEAKVNYYDNDDNYIDSQSVIDLQEPDWDFINFVRVMNGQGRIVFYIENADIGITFSYKEQKEII